MSLYKANVGDVDYVIDQVAEFAKHQAMEGAILQSVDLVGRGDFDKVLKIVRHFADALGTAARQNPKRFVALALRIPKEADPAYFSRIVHELTNPDAPDRAENWEPA